MSSRLPPPRSPAIPSASDEAHHDALGDEPCFLFAREDLDAGAACLFGAHDELGAVGGIAHGRGGEGFKVLDLEDARDGAEAHERLERPLHGLLPQSAGGGDRAAEPAQHFLVEQRGGRAHRALVDDEADRVGADIDHADRLKVGMRPQLLDQTLQARQSWPLLSLCQAD